MEVGLGKIDMSEFSEESRRWVKFLKKDHRLQLVETMLSLSKVVLPRRL